MSRVPQSFQRSDISPSSADPKGPGSRIFKYDPLPATLPSDTPIRLPDQDTIGRSGPARHFAQHTLSIDPSEGLVVGVTGPWGSGKTSFINLAQTYWEMCDIQVITFNPWMFSGTEQLVNSFFVELSAQLRLKPSLRKIGHVLADLGEGLSGIGWVPVIGPWSERIRALIRLGRKLITKTGNSVVCRRERVRNELVTLDKPIVVILDDIDRLENSEIRNIFKLVRLTTNFPNIIYVLAFDRSRVEDAISMNGLPGREYLEKILQYSYDIPEFPPELLNHELDVAIDRIFVSLEITDVDGKSRNTIIREIVQPLVKNIRDVKRYAMALQGTLTEYRNNVAIADIIALEAIRLFLPSVFLKLYRAMDILTDSYDWEHGGIATVDLSDTSSADKERVDALLEASREHQGVVYSLINNVFPDARQYIDEMDIDGEGQENWLLDRRVAHKAVLKIYFEKFICDDLSVYYREATTAIDLLSNVDELKTYFQSLDRSHLPKVIAYLGTFQRRFTANSVVPSCIVLMNLLSRLPDQTEGLFDPPHWARVTRVVHLLLDILERGDEMTFALQEILEHLDCLSWKRLLIVIACGNNGDAQRLISETEEGKLDRHWRAEVNSTSSSELVREPMLLDILVHAKRAAQPGDKVLDIVGSPKLTLAILQSARQTLKTPSEGGTGVDSSEALDWDLLLQVFDDEAILRAALGVLKSTHLEGSDELIALAEAHPQL